MHEEKKKHIYYIRRKGEIAVRKYPSLSLLLLILKDRDTQLLLRTNRRD